MQAGFVSHCVHMFTTLNVRLTVTPYITLVRVSSVQDRFKSHPFYWYLWKKIGNVIINIIKYFSALHL